MSKTVTQEGSCHRSKDRTGQRPTTLTRADDRDCPDSSTSKHHSPVISHRVSRLAPDRAHAKSRHRTAPPPVPGTSCPVSDRSNRDATVGTDGRGCSFSGDRCGSLVKGSVVTFNVKHIWLHIDQVK